MIHNSRYGEIQTILQALFDREFANLAKREQALITKHTSMGGSADGFRYMGVIYSQLAGRMRSMGNYDRPHESLVPELSAIITERKVLEGDRTRIQQALALVLAGTHTTQEIRDALPNCLQHLVPGLAGLERTREEAYTLVDNPRAYSQYMMIRPKIEFYVAAQLLY